MADDLFLGLPPPSVPAVVASTGQNKEVQKYDAPVLPPAALKSALKRAKPSDSRSEVGGAQKHLRFKTTTDATTAQVVEAMQKIASHIKNPSKFVKASKLAIHLIESGSVKDGTSDLFFSILDAAMVSSDASVNPSLRADYQALFSAAQDIKELLSKKQKNCLTTWTLKVVVGNDLYTDDSFVFSKAAGKIKEAIDCLPFATKDEDAEEAASLEKVEEMGIASLQDPKNSTCNHLPQKNSDTFDPFGLDALLPGKSNKYEKTGGNKEAFASKHKTDGKDESRRFLKSQREVLILCLETAARRYKTPWSQTVIDILVKHAFDNASKFTSRQRDAIEKLWNSVKEQQIRRKQGKSVTGKLDMNGFEFLQEKYANEKISIRHSVGGGGERRAQQWLG